MPDTGFNLPVIDISCIGLDKEDPLDYSSKDVTSTAKQLCDAFKNVGFVYIKNHGITDELLGEINKFSEDFFTLDQDKKDEFTKKPGDYFGYMNIGQEKPDPTCEGDYKECFNIIPSSKQVLPDDHLIPGFQKGIQNMDRCCVKLAERFLSLLAIGLDIKDPHFFKQFHHFRDEKHENDSQFKLCYYLPVGEKDVSPNQFRCAEHTDDGSITFVFQDGTGGLEVLSRDGEYTPATPIPGTIVVNIGDLIQRWSADVLVSHRHRVVIPSGEKRHQLRKSVIFFVLPDMDATIECADGSNKYPPVKANEYMLKKWYTYHDEDKQFITE